MTDHCADGYCDFSENVDEEITARAYQQKAMETNDGRDSYRLADAFHESFDAKIDVPELINGLMGLSGECGETVEVFKKWIFQGAPLDTDQAKAELGDVFWYAALICHSMGWDFNDIMEGNLQKISERYPEGFDVERSNNREEGA